MSSLIASWGVYALGIVVGLFGIASLFSSALALRAQSRAHFALLEEAHSDEKLRGLIEQATTGKALSDDELRVVREKVRHIIAKLPSERDQLYVSQGVGQANTASANSYLLHTLKDA